MQIKILYFAQLADLAGKTVETRKLSSHSPADLYAELKAAYRFPHDFKQLQVAINHELSAHEAELKDGDEVAFLPPMTGG
ncbi:MAG TPA: molybdopterin synthase sulfur carrier subunit [Opitutae bacterium]|nr:molybdopterin synthase sulfur carrier subunit [Opitutae bacterium]